MQHLPAGIAVAPPPPLPAVAAQEGGIRINIGYTIEQAERALIEMTLEHTKNNKTRAAEILGISQKTMFNKLREYGGQAATAND